MIPLLTPRLYAAAGAAIVVALLLAWVARIDHLRAQHKRETIECQANFAKFRADVEARTELARISDAAHKAEVERNQEKIRADSDAEIRRRIADAVSRVRAGSSSNRVSRGGGAPVSRPADAPGSPAGDGEASELSTADRMICAENTVKVEGWQDWYRQVAAIPR